MGRLKRSQGTSVNRRFQSHVKQSHRCAMPKIANDRPMRGCELSIAFQGPDDRAKGSLFFPTSKNVLKHTCCVFCLPPTPFLRCRCCCNIYRFAALRTRHARCSCCSRCRSAILALSGRRASGGDFRHRLGSLLRPLVITSDKPALVL